MDFTLTTDLDEAGNLAGVSFYGEKPLYLFDNTPVAVHDVWKSNGISYAAVTAAETIFTTEGRYPRPTAHGTVPVSELTPLAVEGSAYAEALENWVTALDDTITFEDNQDRANYFAAEIYAQECGQIVAGFLV